MTLYEKTLHSETLFTGHIIKVRLDTVQLPNGKNATREVVNHPGGVGILALDEKNNVLTVKQYRYVYGQTLLEIPAGKLEPGEDPYAAALRELVSRKTEFPDMSAPAINAAYPGRCQSLTQVLSTSDARVTALSRQP